jgi:hypothetical protein
MLALFLMDTVECKVDRITELPRAKEYSLSNYVLPTAPFWGAIFAGGVMLIGTGIYRHILTKRLYRNAKEILEEKNNNLNQKKEFTTQEYRELQQKNLLRRSDGKKFIQTVTDPAAGQEKSYMWETFAGNLVQENWKIEKVEDDKVTLQRSRQLIDHGNGYRLNGSRLIGLGALLITADVAYVHGMYNTGIDRYFMPRKPIKYA